MPRADGSVTPRWLGTIPSLGSLLGIVEQEEITESTEKDAQAARFAVGEFVEYHSASAGSWIPAKIVVVRDDGLYDLDCKQEVPPTKVRPATFAKPDFEVGASVEYLSDTQGVWIPARVKMYNAMAGTYDLDCKQHVPPRRIRLPAVSTRPPSPEEKQEEVSDSKDGIGMGSGETEEELGARVSHTSTCPVEHLLPQQDGPIQLIKVSRHGTSWHFELCPEAVKVLEACGQQQLAVCTVCGPYRTGKSYLLNLLLGRGRQGNSQFRVGSTTRACTDGLWMWGFGRVRGGDSPSLLFLDCEGFGSTESDKTRDAKLMSLCMQLSSVFLLNTKGVLSESLFGALSLVCNMAEHFEEQETSKPALLWVLRDFLLELMDDGGARLTPDEYLESTLHKKPPEGVDPQRSQAAREVRENLLKFFPHRQCATLCQPAIDEQQLRELPEVPFEKLRKEFRNAFQELQTRLFRLTDSPKTIGGQPLCVSQWTEMLRKLVRCLNEGQAMRVDDSWTQVEHSSCGDLVTELRERASSELQKVRKGGPFPIPGGRPLPVSDTVLVSSLKECRKAIREEFRSRAVGGELVKASYWKELKAALQEDEQLLRHLNAELAEASLRQAGADWAAWLSQDEASAADPQPESLLKAFGSELPAQPVARAAWDAVSSARMARLKADGMLEASKAQLKLVTEELESKAMLAAAASKQAMLAAEKSKLAEGEQLEKNRAMGQLQSQVEALQQQVRDFIERERTLKGDFIERERALKEQVLQAEQSLRKEQHERSEVGRESEQRIQELQSQVAELRSEVLQLQEWRHETSASPRDTTRPKCTCSIM